MNLRLQAFRGLVLTAIVAALVGSFRLGLERGFDHTIGVEAYGRMLFAIGAAVSDEVHGKHGYVIDNVVDSALTNGGLTADPNILASLGTSFPENLQNPVLLDSTLHQAMKSPNTVSAVRSASADDPGMVDFVRLGFDLFGYRLLSLYLTYVLLFVIPFWAFWQAFRNEPSSIAILAIAAVAHLAILASDFFDLTGTTLGSVTNPRFLSILGVIPALHIALAMLHRHPPSPQNVALVGVQACLLVFALWIRASAVWMPFGLILLGCGIALRSLRLRQPAELRFLWGFGILIGVWMVHSLYVAQALNPVYSDKGAPGYHTVWHSIYYSLQFHPDWGAKYGPTHDNVRGDELPWVAAKNYIARHPPADPASLYQDTHGTLKFTAMETYVRKAFFELLANDPLFVLETFFIYKPRFLFSALTQHAGSLQRVPRSAIWIMVGLAITLMVFFALHVPERRELMRTTMVLSAAFAVSLIPILLTVPYATVIGDQFFVLLISAGAWAVVLVSLVARGCMLIGGLLVAWAAQRLLSHHPAWM
jgi:hypothetical protein